MGKASNSQYEDVFGKLLRMMKTKKKEEPVKRDHYTFVAYVSGPVYKFDVSARSFDEASSLATGLLNNEIERFKGEVQVDKIYLAKFGDNNF